VELDINLEDHQDQEKEIRSSRLRGGVVVLESNPA
jgi:hypothetical protein